MAPSCLSIFFLGIFLVAPSGSQGLNVTDLGMNKTAGANVFFEGLLNLVAPNLKQ